MEEEKLKEIFAKTDKDYSRFYDFIRYYYKKEHFSNRNVMGFSILISGLFTHKYLNNRIIYQENNGHFNSPQNLLNRKLSRNYMMEGAFRFLIGSVAIFFGVNLFKIYYLKIEEPLFDYDSETEEQKKLKKDIEDIFLVKEKVDAYNEEKIVKVGADLSIEDLKHKDAQKIYGIDQSLNFRDNINKYYEKYK